MKTVLLSVLALAFALVAPASAQNLKIAVVDMPRVLKEYYKTQEAEARLNEAASGYQKDLNERRESYSKLIDQIRTLQEEARDPSLSEAKKKEKMSALEEKVKDAQVKERENMNHANTVSKLVQDQRRRANENIMEDINKTVAKVAKEQKYTLVLVKADFPSPVLYSEVDDLSTSVIKELNKDKPAAK